VRKLEERFGVLLFHRNKRSVRLTDLGERLLAITQRLFVIEAEAQELLQESQALQTGSLILAVDAPVHVLPQIARFCERYPGISVKIETGNTDESLFRLFNYQADLALLGVMSAMNVCCACRCAMTRWWRSFRAIIRGPSVSRSAWRIWMTRRWCCASTAR
jgi:DNA-binding transcriptional LysR family regulator